MLFAGASAAAALTPPLAGAQTDPTLPRRIDSGCAVAIGGSTTECATPGNVSINATPAEPTYVYPWDDEFYGAALIMGGGGGYHGDGGGHGGR